MIRKKTGGRQKGVPNKVTKMHRSFIQKILDGQTGRIEVELNKLKGTEYLKIIVGLIQFAVPKLSRMETLGYRVGNSDEPEDE